MAKERRNVNEIRKAAQEHLDARMKSLELSKEEFQSMQNITDTERERYENLIELQKQRLELDALRNEYAKDLNNLTGRQKKAMQDDYKKRKETIYQLEEQLNILQSQTEETKKQYTMWQKITGVAKELNSFIGGSTIWKFLMESDKGIKKTALQLGLSGERADILRFNIEQSAQYAARMGVSVTELSEAQATYAEETGRMLLLNEQSLNAIVDMGKATKLGTQDAAKLAAQFELIGLNAVNSAEKVQGIVDQAERMGVSATKTLKKVSDNFEAINKFAFKDGVDSFAKMAMYAERFKIDMGSMLDSAERARTLEGAVELAAELQVMGGEFAKTDPFEMLFLSRNDPEKYQKKINNMTKGIAKFRKTADGTFEAYISPMDLDRLERAGKALGLSREEMAKQGKQMLKMQSISRDLMGTGISAEDREMIAGMAEFNAKTGQYFVNLKGATMSISQIGSQHLKALKAQNDDLNDRALAAQTFDDAWNNTIMEFKATLLPLVRGINEMLTDIRPTVSNIMDGIGKFMSAGDSFMAKLGIAVAGLVTGGRLIGGAVTKFSNLKNAWDIIRSATKDKDKSTSVSKVSKTVSGGAGKAAAGAGKAGMGMLRGGAGVGAAGLGVGAGIGAAALGIAELAKAMKDLDTDQLNALMVIGGGLAITLPLMGVGLLAVGTAATAAWPGLLALGGAVTMIGAGIGVAAAGIGYMSKGIGELASDDKAKNLSLVAAGLSSIMGAMSGEGLGGTIKGLGNMAALTTTMASMAIAGSQMEGIERTFAGINAVMNGDVSNLMKVKDTVKSISEMDMGNNSAIASLTKLLSQPIKVEFADEKVAINVDTTLELDGDVLYRKVISQYSNIRKQNSAREGKDSVKNT